MNGSRRNFIRIMGLGAVAGAAPFPGLTARAKAVETSRPGPIRLNSNENPYGPSALALAAMRAATESANRYPFAAASELRKEIAVLHGVKPEQVLLGCGSSEILRMAACAFLDGGGDLVQAWPTFSAMQSYAEAGGARVIQVRLTRDLTHDTDAMLSRIGKGPTLVYVCNPNNPTGSVTPRSQLDGFLAKLPGTAHVLIDEAYHHYAVRSASYESFLDRPAATDRVIVTRTFSKVYALAGLRVGYGIASPAVADRLQRFATQTNVNAVAAKAAIAALRDTASVAESVRRNADVRQEFFNQAMARMYRLIDSQTNFVLMNTHRPALPVIEHFRRNNILVAGPIPEMRNYMRVSFGTPAEMIQFWKVFDQLPRMKMAM